jgi:hypothetical protein
MEKPKFAVTCPGMRFLWKPHYVTHRSHWMQNHKFSVTCPVVLFMKTASGPPKLEK